MIVRSTKAEVLVTLPPVALAVKAVPATIGFAMIAVFEDVTVYGPVPPEITKDLDVAPAGQEASFSQIMTVVG
ncbi:MAG TPA: hypothetical protein VN260_10920 [Dissulfurispiraceae bacterium]|nr:hypothetical protein [Dissulfurispiraceae bacterium]